MMIEVRRDPDDMLVITARGKLTAEDYRHAIPEIEEELSARHDGRILVQLEDFAGWEARALWRDLRFDVAHRKDFARIAVVGDTPAERWLTWLSSVFFKGDVRYYDRSCADRARIWLHEA